MTHRENFDSWCRELPERLAPFEATTPDKAVTHRRFAIFDHTRAQEDQRTVEAVLSTEEPVLRSGYREILAHSERNVDLHRADDGVIPLLWNHDSSQQLGSVRNIRVYQNTLRGTLHFARNEFAEQKWQDVREGHLRGISIGYNVDKYDEPEQRGGLPDVRVTRWTLFEASCVTIPADTKAGVGRSLTRQLEYGLLREVPVNLEALREEQGLHSMWPQIEGIREHPKFQKAFDELYRLVGEKQFTEARELSLEIFNQARASYDRTHEDGSQSLAEPKYSDITQTHNLRLQWNKPNEEKSGGSTMSKYQPFFINESVGERGLESFSFSRALAGMFDPAAARQAGFELEFMRETSKARGKSEGYALPGELLFTRDVTKGTTGGNLVGTDHLSGNYIETLQAMMVTGRLGITTLPGLVGDVSIPKGATDSTAGWIAGDGSDDVSQSDPTFAAVTMQPKTVGGFSVFSRKMLLQGLPSVDALIRRSLAFSVAKALDSAVLNGSGTSNQPLGILGQTGVALNTYANGGSPSFNDLVDLEGELMADDAPLSSLGYATTGTLASVLKKTQVVSGQDRMVWETTEAGEGRVNGYRAVHSSIVPAGNVIFGNWSEVMLGLWSGLDITTDPYTEATAGNVRIIVMQDADVAVRHGQSFAAISEAAP
jgi:HK97 family phage major capsid protein/HK97 family phage prohead protease